MPQNTTSKKVLVDKLARSAEKRTTGGEKGPRAVRERAVYTTKVFVMVVLGGMGSIEGAAFGGLVLGLSESLPSLYLGNQWALIIDFALFLLVLSFKPSGIFGRQRA